MLYDADDRDVDISMLPSKNIYREHSSQVLYSAGDPSRFVYISPKVGFRSSVSLAAQYHFVGTQLSTFATTYNIFACFFRFAACYIRTHSRRLY